MADIGPIDLTKLLAGACRVLHAPTTVAIPTNLADIIALTGAGAPMTGWVDFGATGESSSYERGLDSKDYEVEQRSGAVLSEITGTTRTFTTTLSQITPEHLQIVEEAPAITTFAAAAGKSAQKIVRAGSIDELTRHRIAFIGRRKKSQALVTETAGGVTRGAYVAGVLLNCSLTADNVALELAKGSLAGVKVQFQAYPEATATPGQDVVMWIEEQTGVIA